MSIDPAITVDVFPFDAAGATAIGEITITATIAAEAPPDDARPIEAWVNDRRRLRLHAIGVRAYQQGNRAIWTACYVAQHIVGQYARGATRAFATDINRSVDTVENMAHAARLYAELARAFHRDPLWHPLLPRLRELRARLYYSHFAEMYAILRGDLQNALEVFGQLDQAAQNGTSTRALSREAGGAAGLGSVTLPLRSPRNKDVKAILADPPPDTWVVIVQGDEWQDVEEVKVRPA